MEPITYILKDNKGYIVNKFEVTELRTASFDGICYEAWSWTLDGIPTDYSFVADTYCKFDSCTHWWFKGEDFDGTENRDSYYHLCGSYSFISHIRSMCFVWAIASELLADEHGDYYFGDNEDKDIWKLCDLILKDYVIEKLVGKGEET